jgi:hypothetical protein
MWPSTRLEGKPKSFAIFVQFISLPILINIKNDASASIVNPVASVLDITLSIYI